MSPSEEPPMSDENNLNFFDNSTNATETAVWPANFDFMDYNDNSFNTAATQWEPQDQQVADLSSGAGGNPFHGFTQEEVQQIMQQFMVENGHPEFFNEQQQQQAYPPNGDIESGPADFGFDFQAFQADRNMENDIPMFDASPPENNFVDFNANTNAPQSGNELIDPALLSGASQCQDVTGISSETNPLPSDPGNIPPRPSNDAFAAECVFCNQPLTAHDPDCITLEPATTTFAAPQVSPMMQQQQQIPVAPQVPRMASFNQPNALPLRLRSTMRPPLSTSGVRTTKGVKTTNSIFLRRSANDSATQRQGPGQPNSSKGKAPLRTNTSPVTAQPANAPTAKSSAFPGHPSYAANFHPLGKKPLFHPLTGKPLSTTPTPTSFPTLASAQQYLTPHKTRLPLPTDDWEVVSTTDLHTYSSLLSSAITSHNLKLPSPQRNAQQTQARILSLISLTVSLHKDGMPTPIYRNNLPSAGIVADKTLKCSERMLQIIDVVREDRGIAMEILTGGEGRKLEELVMAPKAYLRRKREENENRKKEAGEKEKEQGKRKRTQNQEEEVDGGGKRAKQ